MKTGLNILSFNLYPIQFCIWDGGFWFRLFGFGFIAKDTSRNPLLFSERQGLKKGIQIRQRYFRLLKRNGN